MVALRRVPRDRLDTQSRARLTSGRCKRRWRFVHRHQNGLGQVRWLGLLALGPVRPSCAACFPPRWPERRERRRFGFGETWTVPPGAQTGPTFLLTCGKESFFLHRLTAKVHKNLHKSRVLARRVCPSERLLAAFFLRHARFNVLAAPWPSRAHARSSQAP
jgi:hypothetical protein